MCLLRVPLSQLRSFPWLPGPCPQLSPGLLPLCCVLCSTTRWAKGEGSCSLSFIPGLAWEGKWGLFCWVLLLTHTFLDAVTTSPFSLT